MMLGSELLLASWAKDIEASRPQRIVMQINNVIVNLIIVDVVVFRVFKKARSIDRMNQPEFLAWTKQYSNLF